MRKLLLMGMLALSVLAEAKGSRDTFTVLTWNTEHYGWWNRTTNEQERLERNMFEIVPAEQFERTAAK